MDVEEVVGLEVGLVLLEVGEVEVRSSVVLRSSI